MPEREKYLKISEVAEWVGVSANTLRHWRATGQGGPRSGRLGRRVVYRETDVKEWLDAQFEHAS